MAKGRMVYGAAEFVQYQNCEQRFAMNNPCMINLQVGREIVQTICITKGIYYHWRKFPRFNRYVEGEFMEKHNDHIYSCFDGSQKVFQLLV